MIKLSVSEKGYALFRDGNVIISQGYSYTNKRDAILRNLQRGILKSVDYIQHEDLLVIEVGDSYTYRWLYSELPNKNHISAYSATNSVLDKLICRYRFSLNKRPSVNGLSLERAQVALGSFDLEVEGNEENNPGN